MINERPILFSGPMIEAILAGKKTQTRRALNRDKVYNGFAFDDPRIARACPYGVPGDKLWVRETWSLVPRTAYAKSAGVQQSLRPDDDHDAAIYRAGWVHTAPSRWRPSIFMPRWASRITLEVVSARVERLQDISEADAKAEGVVPLPGLMWKPLYSNEPFREQTHRDKFEILWDNINEKRGYPWESNPWVWVVTFKRVEP